MIDKVISTQNIVFMAAQHLAAADQNVPPILLNTLKEHNFLYPTDPNYLTICTILSEYLQ